MADNVTIIEFLKSAQPYRTGEQAGFDHDTAELYVLAGFAKIVRADVPRVEASVMASDMHRQLETFRANLVGAKTQANAELANPATADAAREALRRIAETEQGLEAMQRQLQAAGLIEQPSGRRPNAASRAG